MMKRLAAVAIVLAAMALVAAKPSSPTVEVELYGDGSARVTHRVPADPPAIVSVELLGSPALLMVTDDGLNPLEFNLTENVLSALLLEGEAVLVSYETKLGSWNGSLLEFTIPGSEGRTVLIIPHNMTIVLVDPVPDAISSADGSIMLEYDNPLEIKVALVGSPEESAGPAGGQSTEEGALPTYLAILPIAAALVVLLRRRKSPPITEEEEAILDFVRRRGGRAYMSEIREALELPASTSWRKVRRLEKLGLVKVTRTPAGLLVEVS